MMTLLSSHTIGRKRSHARLLSLVNSFTFGVIVMTVLLLSFFALVLTPIVSNLNQPMLPWTICCGLLAGIGISVWLFYYRKEAGTTLWVPRSIAKFLGRRAKATKHSAEAFSLGVTSVLGELLFIVAPLSVATLALLTLDPSLQLAAIALYSVVSLTSLLIVNALIGSGHSISRIQKWRETNKKFLQFAAGSALVVLAFYVYVEEVVTQTVMAAARNI